MPRNQQALSTEETFDILAGALAAKRSFTLQQYFSLLRVSLHKAFPDSVYRLLECHSLPVESILGSLQEWFEMNASEFPYEHNMAFDALRGIKVYHLSSVQPVPMATAPLSLNRIVARNSFHGGERIDAVQVADNMHGTWYGKVHLLFRFFSATNTCVNFAVVLQYESKKYLPDRRNSISDFYLVRSSHEWKFQVVNTNAIDHRVVFIRDFRFENRYIVYK
jgi:hypothetical protein